MIFSERNPKEISECRKQMARILAQPHLFVKSLPLESSKRRYYFHTIHSSKAETGDRPYSVIPFFETEIAKYWVGVSVDIELGRQCSLRDVSLIVFEGEVTDPVKNAAFRAEWHDFDDTERRHAQPHWHVYSIIDESIRESWTILKKEPEIRDFKADKLPPSKQFHFAMGSQWQLSSDSHMVRLDFNNLYKWLNGCINYILGQFCYLYSS
jgi:hypothetical protein